MKRLHVFISSIFHENKFITDFREKAELFNAFFVNQCFTD